MQKHRTSVFIFRRDLRLEDNLGLLTALEQSTSVVPIFIFDPRQIDPQKNHYFSAPAFSFLLRSLAELRGALEAHGSKLYVFLGEPHEVIAELIKKDGIDAVYVNKDYTPFSRKRDKAIADVCTEASIPLTRVDDVVLSPIEEIRTGTGKLYSVFTPFMKNAMGYEVAIPRKNDFSNYFSGSLKAKTVALSDFQADTKGMELILTGGREEGLGLLRALADLSRYKDTRNLPAELGTSRLSAHHKFGTISIRETYAKAAEVLGAHNQYVAELYWRDFYYYIAYHFPIVFKQPFLPWAKHLAWVNDKDQFKAWCEGKTGVPMVDAGMRELNHTGWMHNRSRMIVASYLTKNLLIDWQWGEQYFASKLIDYDPAQNNGGWQWSASTGADPRPLRIFNPYTQATNYDPHALYIRTWVPELKDIDPKLLTDGKTQDFSEHAPGYPAPIIDQKESYHRAMAAYKQAKETWQKNSSNE